MYKILEDENGKFWVAKISKTRIILQRGTWNTISKVHTSDIGYIKDYPNHEIFKDVFIDTRIW